MAEWMSWLHAPEFTDEKFQKLRQEHIDKEGYTLTVPGLTDIFKWGEPPPMNSAERMWWGRDEMGFFPPGRLEELAAIKAKKTAKFEAMLGAPTPSIISNAGSVMCAIDDAQDAISTLACIGSVARAVAPRMIARALLGPVGILWAVADLLNLLQAAPMACLGKLNPKRLYARYKRGCPKQTRLKMWDTKRLSRAVPRQADWIQAAQVTTSVFGYGICLGPLVGLVTDTVSGLVRTFKGEKVKVKIPWEGVEEYVGKAYNCVKSLGAALTYPIMTDDEDVLTLFASSTLSYQVLQNDLRRWHPIDMLEDVGTLEVRAPVPTDPLTLEVIEEAGIPLAECIGWPQTDQLWSSIQDLADTTQWGVTENLERFVLRNKHSFMGFVGAETATESARFALAALEPDETIDVDFTPSAKIVEKMLGASMCLAPTMPPAKLRDFAGYMHQCDRDDYNPSLKEIRDFCYGPADIELVGF